MSSTPAASAHEVVRLRADELPDAMERPDVMRASVVVVSLGLVADLTPPIDSAVLEWLRSPARLSVAVIAGTAGGPEVSVMLACDLVVMADSARLQFGESASAWPGQGVLERLVSRVGPSGALLLSLHTDPIEAADAGERGLVDAVVPDGEVPGWVDAIVMALAQRPPGWTSEAKALIAAAAGAPHEPAGRERLRRWEADAAQRIAAEGSPDPGTNQAP